MRRYEHFLTVFLISLMPKEVRQMFKDNYFFYIQSRKYENKLLDFKLKYMKEKYFKSIPKPPKEIIDNHFNREMLKIIRNMNKIKIYNIGDKNK